MAISDPLGDMLTRIRNAQMRRKSVVQTPASKLRCWVLDVLVDEGYIRGYEKSTGEGGHPALEISLKYFENSFCFFPIFRCIYIHRIPPFCNNTNFFF